MSDTPKHSVSVAGVVRNQNDEILAIQRRDNSRWEPPGGVLELDETPEAGVIREVYEETGVQVVVDSLSGVYKNMTRGIVSLVFRCHPIGGQKQETDESLETRWLPLDIVHQTFLPAYAVRVEDAFGQGVSVRVHDGTNLIDD